MKTIKEIEQYLDSLYGHKLEIYRRLDEIIIRGFEFVESDNFVYEEIAYSELTHIKLYRNYEIETNNESLIKEYDIEYDMSDVRFVQLNLTSDQKLEYLMTYFS